jgi:hypothetical protein
MKAHFPLLFFVFSVMALHGQEAAKGVPKPEPITQELAIPSNIFVPSLPPKEVPAMKVEAVTKRVLATHQFTILRSEPSTLPDIPKPPPPKPYANRPAGEGIPLLSIGATVYDHRLSLVRWHDPKTKIWTEAWCAWDISLLAPLQRVKVGDQSRMFFLHSSHVDTAKESKLRKSVDLPEMPDLQANGFSVIKGGDHNGDTQLILASLRDFHVTHSQRLSLIRKAQKEYLAAAAAWHKANPPRPQNHTIWLKPHRGSRYLNAEGGAK